MKEMGLALSAAGGFRNAIASLVLVGLGLSLLESATLLVLFSFVTFLINPDAPLPRLLQPLSAWLGGYNTWAQAFLILVLATLRYLLSLWQEWRMARLWVEIRGHMQEVMLDRHLHSRYGYLAQRKLGEHVHHVIESPSFAAVFYLHLVRFLSTSIMLLVLFATLLAISPLLLLIAVGIGLVYLLIIRIVSNKLSYQYGVRRSATVKRQMELVTEGIAGVRYLKLLRHYPQWLQEFSSVTAAATQVMHRSGFWNTFPARSLEYLVILFFMAMVLSALEGGGGFSVESIPTIAVYFLGIVRILPSLYILGSGRTEMMRALPSLKLFVELRDGLPQETVRGGSADVPSLRDNAIQFDDVAFSYGDQPVLQAFDLSLAPRTILAIAGASGEGKSTMLDLLLRLIEPSSGEIRVDSRNINQFNLLAWRNRFAYVGQDPFLFHATLRENIRLGNPAASEAEMARAISLACVADFADDLPQGLDSVLAEGGRSLSGGQRQRVALARALVSRADVLLLDEPTSALDPDTERRVLTGVLSECRDRTIVLVTHREDVLKHADRIVVLHGGRIQETGTYAELLESGANFRRVFQQA